MVSCSEDLKTKRTVHRKEEYLDSRPNFELYGKENFGPVEKQALKVMVSIPAVWGWMKSIFK